MGTAAMPQLQNGQKSTQQPRAPRFPIRTRLSYREAGATDWHEGKSVNISSSGVLFEAEQRLELKTMLEMRIVFPPEIAGQRAADVICWGPVVRIAREHSPANPSEMAAAIIRYRFS
jgi:hypothetical protein